MSDLERFDMAVEEMWSIHEVEGAVNIKALAKKWKVREEQLRIEYFKD